jgi:hypothetical protein
MSFKSPACSYGTPLSQVNFFKSPKNGGKVICFNDLMRMSNSVKEEVDGGMSGSGKLMERDAFFKK